MPHQMPRVSFYFDVGSPYAHLASQRLGRVLPEPVHWQPVLLGGLFKLTSRSSWALGDHRRRQAGMAEIERRATSYGLAPMRWPDPWPADYLTAMRAVTFGFAAGYGRELARELFCEAFQRGGDLSVSDRVFEVAELVGLEPAAVRSAVQDPEIKHKLRAATEAAYELGVFGVPTVAVDDELFWGDDRLEDAAAVLRAAPAG